MDKQRKIIHIDCDCFYAAVEMRDNPSLRSKPIAVGGTGRRGVLSTCNYVARHFGIRSAMPTAWAMRLCPDLEVLPTRMSVYREASEAIMAILGRYSDLIQPLSLDEAFIDVTDCDLYRGSATWIAEDIRRTVEAEVGITVSAGVAPNKFLAKIASDWNKPNGIKVITPEQVSAFVSVLPVEKIHGVGRVTAERLHRRGLYVCQDIIDKGLREMVERFGAMGDHLFRLSHGIDDRRVSLSRSRKSVSVERTFSEDMADFGACRKNALMVFSALEQRLERVGKHTQYHKFFVKMRFSDFTQTTVETLGQVADLNQFMALLEEAWARQRKPVRLLGMGMRLKSDQNVQQLELFEHRQPLAIAM